MNYSLPESPLNQGRVSKRIITILTLLLAVPVIIGFISIFIPFGKAPSPPKQNEEVIQPTRVKSYSTLKLTSLNSCEVQKEGNPLVGEITRLEDDRIVIFVGRIQAISFAEDETASIELISIRGEQMGKLEVKDREGLVDDQVQDISLSDLKTGQLVRVVFNCFISQGNISQLAQISLITR